MRATHVRPARSGGDLSPYVELRREQWRELRRSTPLTLTLDELVQLRGLGDPVDLEEVVDVYLPLSRLISLQVAARQSLYEATTSFLGEGTTKVPFVIGVAGSVAVGKSTTARLLRTLLARWPNHPHVDLVTTDGFLHTKAELLRRGIMHRKGFPESYDRRGLLRFVSDVKSGAPEVQAPVYSHLAYDIVPDRMKVVRRPDILIVEGLNVLLPGQGLTVADLFDFSIYVDAHTEDIARWYVERFLALRDTAFADPTSHFHHYAVLTDADARVEATRLWREINEPNLVHNILPTRPRAGLVLRKDADHRVSRVRLRKL
jgi:type I pantothenate kinase